MRKRARWPLSIGAKTRVLCSELRRRYAHIDRKFGFRFQFRGRVRFEVSYCLAEKVAFGRKRGRCLIANHRFCFQSAKVFDPVRSVSHRAKWGIFEGRIGIVHIKYYIKQIDGC